MTVAHAGTRLAKRRRALVETNPPRNSQPETHPDDERGRRRRRRRLHRMDRFPHALKNSSSKAPRSGVLVVARRQVRLELRRRHVAQRRVQTPLVVNLLEKGRDGRQRLGQIAIFIA